ncbi:MAG: hypothetical protein R3A79_26500 [Nannocystaceae bacterium]
MLLRSRRGNLEVIETLNFMAPIHLGILPVPAIMTVVFLLVGIDWVMLFILGVLYTQLLTPALFRRRLEIDRDYGSVRLRRVVSVAAALPALTLRTHDRFDLREVERLEILRVPLGRGFGCVVDLVRTTEETPSLAADDDGRVHLHLGYFFLERSAERHAARFAAAFDDLPIVPAPPPAWPGQRPSTPVS